MHRNGQLFLRINVIYINIHKGISRQVADKQQSHKYIPSHESKDIERFNPRGELILNDKKKSPRFKWVVEK